MTLGESGVAGSDYIFSAETAETHSSILIFIADRVYKVRKPIDLGFLDNRCVESRRRVSHAEVELNSRLAKDVYLGVFDVHDSGGQVVDHVVVMRRLPAERCLVEVARRDTEGAGKAVEAVAGALAELHAASPHTTDIDQAGHPVTVAALWTDSLTHLRTLPLGRDAPEIIDDLETLSTAWLAGRHQLFADRIADGRVVDGHGDLLAADIFCLADGPRVIDCLEFDDRLRYGDALLDAGFLSMDLDRRGYPELARRFIAAYRRAAQDEAPPSLLHFYSAYRAVVRSKVAAIRAEQSDDDAARAAAREAVELAAWAADALLRARVRLVLVGGLSGSGKSTFARALAPALAATVIRSDVVRKELAGLPPTAHRGDAVDTGLYESNTTDRTYHEMLERAAHLLRSGHSVIVDATWLDARQRTRAETVAVEAHAELVEVECTAPRQVLLDRVARRRDTGDDPSDATAEVVDLQQARRVPWPDAVVVDTDGELDVRDEAAVALWAHRHVGPL